jgi:hypothetical protein
MAKCAVVFAAMALCTPALANADSDGYFCIGRGYLAYELRPSPPQVAHQLHIVRFGSANGIVPAASVPLDDFQVHGMTCRPGVVELVGWSQTYRVDISDPDRPETAARAVAFDSGQARPAVNLGHWAKEQVIDLAADDRPGEFQLVIARVSQRVPGGIEHHTHSRLIRRAPHGSPGSQIVASLTLFEGVFRETVH